MKTRGILRWRRLVQALTALFFLAVPLLNMAEIHLFSGNFLFFNFAGLPLSDPLSSLQAGLGALSATPGMIVGAALVLLLALLLGPVFCSWLCPFGFFSELLHRRKAPSGAQKNTVPSGRPFLGKVLLVTAGLLAVPLFAHVPLLNQLSMPGWYSRALQHAVLYREVLWGALLLIPAVLLIEGLSGKRFWCRYVCPQSVLISLAGLLPFRILRVRFQARSCTCPANNRACLAACSLDLNPRKPGSLAQLAQCSNCGDCVDACRDKGKALSFTRRRLPKFNGVDTDTQKECG